MDMEYFSTSYKGINRNVNKDSTQIVHTPLGTVFIVYDGVSSARDAKKAISLLKKKIEIVFNDIIDIKMLPISIKKLNDYLVGLKLETPFTTMSLVLISNNFLYSFNVGDSPIYLITKQEINELSEIDTKGNIISNYLGNIQGISVDLKKQKIDQEGVIILCTDGFNIIFRKYLDRIFDIINRYKRLNTIKDKISDLIKNENSDDATIIYIRL